MRVQKSKLIIERTLRLYLWIMVLIFVILFIRLSWLQLIKSEVYRTRAVSNIMRLVPEVAPRGEITDTKGRVLVTNRPVFNLCLDYLGLKDTDMNEIILKLVEIIDDPELTAESIKETVKAQGSRLYEPIVVMRDIPIELVSVVEERRRDLPGVIIKIQPQRSYPEGTLAGHLLGYVHSIKEELEDPKYEGYGIGELVGKTGVEKTYEQYLHGKNGYTQMEVTVNNRPVREVRKIDPIPGNTLVLTLDFDLQRVMEDAFDEMLERVGKIHPKAQAGAGVLLDVKTGKVLAMVSRPGLNPDDFNGKSLSQEQADYYFRNTPTALRNRAIQGNYVPGSTFKPITGMAALESGVNPEMKITCSGSYWNPPYIKCTGVHGPLNYYSGMAKSCNVYFQEVARRAGIATIGKVGQEFGLGGPTGIDLPFESSGLLPHLEWQQNEFALRSLRINKEIDDTIQKIEEEYQTLINNTGDEKEKARLRRELNSKKNTWEQERKIRLKHSTEWHDYDTYNTGIGQGYNQFSIIQLANYVATLANGGSRYKPYVVDKILTADGKVIKELYPELVYDTTVSQNTIQETRKAMVAVTQPGGTAYSLFYHFPEEIQVAAKTGTAQPGRAGYVKNKDFDGVFIAFAPADDPQIAFAGVVEHGGSGSGSAGLVAKAVFEKYFEIGKYSTKEVP